MTKASRQEHRSSPRYGAGVLASLIAESAFLVVMAGIAWLRGMDPWRVTRAPATFIIGPDAVEPRGFVPEDVLLGLAMHLALAILVGLLYAFLLPRLSLSPLAGGLLTGILLYGFGSWILPLLFPNWLAPLWLPPAGKVLQLVTHTIYGLVFGFTFHRFTRYSATPAA